MATAFAADPAPGQEPATDATSLVTTLHRIAVWPSIGQPPERVEESLARLLERVTSETGAAACSIEISTPELPGLYIKASRAREGEHDDELVQSLQAAASRLAISRGRAVAMTSPEPSPPTPDAPPFGAVLCVPLKVLGRVAGAFTAYFPGPVELGEAQVSFYELVSTFLGMHIEHGHLAEAAARGYSKTVSLLVAALEGRDPYTRGHSQRVANLGAAIAAELQLPEADQQTLREVGQLHDLGKVGIEPSLLNKTAPLTAEDWELIRRHPVEGERILSPLKWLKSDLRLVRSHHERLDGTGYPDGLYADAIPMLVRVLAVADAYDAMTSRRAYRPAKSHEQALLELRAHAGRRYCPEALRALAHVVSSQQNQSPRATPHPPRRP
ncbi:MAG: HD-GYP domain-containing protein [Armatimonadota bacterium]